MEWGWCGFDEGMLVCWLLVVLVNVYWCCFVFDFLLCECLVLLYLVGCKCIIYFNDYYLVLVSFKVELVMVGIVCVIVCGVLIDDGCEYVLDIFVCVIGYDILYLLVGVCIEGVGGWLLLQVWCDGLSVYFGIIVLGFFNFFLMFGFNMVIGYILILFYIEFQVEYVIVCMQCLCCEGW